MISLTGHDDRRHRSEKSPQKTAVVLLGQPYGPTPEQYLAAIGRESGPLRFVFQP